MIDQAAGTAAALAALGQAQPAAWQWVIEHYGEDVSAIARRLSTRPEEVGDAVQEAFLHLLAVAPRFDPGNRTLDDADAYAQAWLRRVVINCCCDLVRTSRQRQEHEQPLLHEPHSDPEEADGDEQRGVLLKTMADLSPVDRECLVLRHVYQLSGAKLAQALGCTALAARLRVHRAQRRLRRLLGRVGFATALMLPALPAAESWRGALAGIDPRMPPPMRMSRLFAEEIPSSNGGRWALVAVCAALVMLTLHMSFPNFLAPQAETLPLPESSQGLTGIGAKDDHAPGASLAVAGQPQESGWQRFAAAHMFVDHQRRLAWAALGDRWYPLEYMERRVLSGDSDEKPVRDIKGVEYAGIVEHIGAHRCAQVVGDAFESAALAGIDDLQTWRREAERAELASRPDLITDASRHPLDKIIGIVESPNVDPICGLALDELQLQVGRTALVIDGRDAHPKARVRFVERPKPQSHEQLSLRGVYSTLRRDVEGQYKGWGHGSHSNLVACVIERLDDQPIEAGDLVMSDGTVSVASATPAASSPSKGQEISALGDSVHE